VDEHDQALVRVMLLGLAVWIVSPGDTVGCSHVAVGRRYGRVCDLPACDRPVAGRTLRVFASCGKASVSLPFCLGMRC
jgi:hypothetical protein